MIDVRRWWPDISNSEIDELDSYGCYELLLIRRLVDNIGGGKELSKDDLLKGIESDKLGRLDDASKSLEQKKFLLKKPKPGGVTIYQVDPKSYTQTLKKFAEMIRTNGDLADALRSDKYSSSEFLMR
jgi:hypothetical protein